MTGKIQIIEVGPRDGFQNIKEFLPTATKISIIDQLIAAGIRVIEITSFVNPRAVPQMADAEEVAISVKSRYPNLQVFALIPNLRGAKAAVACGINKVSCVISASEAHNKANINRTIADSLQELANIREELPELIVRLDIATAFACPFNGITPVEDIMKLIDRAARLNIFEIALCDTIGVANPRQVREIAETVQGAFPDTFFTMHLHNTRGMGLANTYAAIQSGITAFETSIGGLGGCPFAPGAAGNTATEDTVNMLQAMGLDSGIDMGLLLETVEYLTGNVPAVISSSMSKACRFPI